MQEEYKKCKCCGQEKKISEFQWRSDRQKYRNICVECYKKRQSAYSKKHFQKNKDRIIEQRKERRRKDHMFRLAANLRCRTTASFKRNNFARESGIKEILGAELDLIKQHLEDQFQDGMTWENMGEWHIDHIIPLASAKTKEELICLCHYSNLQPLWATDNLSKGDRL